MQFAARCVIPFVPAVRRRVRKKAGEGAGRGDARKDWFLGQELTLTGLVAGATQLLDKIAAIKPNVPITPEETTALLATAVFTFIALVLLFPVMSFHQEWDDRDGDKVWQLVFLGVVANGFGVGLMAYFLLWVRS